MACGGSCGCDDCSKAQPSQGVALAVAPAQGGGRADPWAPEGPGALPGRVVAKPRRSIGTGGGVGSALRPEGSTWESGAGPRRAPSVSGSPDDAFGLHPPQSLERRLSPDEEAALLRAARGPQGAAPPDSASYRGGSPEAPAPVPLQPPAGASGAPLLSPPSGAPSAAPFLLSPAGATFGLGEFGPTSTRGKGGGGGPIPPPPAVPKTPDYFRVDDVDLGLGRPVGLDVVVPASVGAPAAPPCACECECVQAPPTMASSSLLPGLGSGGANFLQPPYYVQPSPGASRQPMAVLLAPGAAGSPGAAPGQFSRGAFHLLSTANAPGSPLASQTAALSGVAGLEHAVATSANPISYAGDPAATPGNALVRAATNGQLLSAQVARAAAAPGIEQGTGPSAATISSQANGFTAGFGFGIDLESVSQGVESALDTSRRLLDPSPEPLGLVIVPGSALDIIGGGRGPTPKPGDPKPPKDNGKKDRKQDDPDTQPRERSGGGGGGKLLEVLTDASSATVIAGSPGGEAATAAPLSPPLHPGGALGAGGAALLVPSGTLPHVGAGPGGSVPKGSWPSGGSRGGFSARAPSGSGLPNSAQPRGGPSRGYLGPQGSFPTQVEGDGPAPLTPPAVQITSRMLRASQFADTFGGSKGQAVEDPFSWGKPAPTVASPAPKAPPVASAQDGTPSVTALSPAFGGLPGATPGAISPQASATYAGGASSFSSTLASPVTGGLAGRGSATRQGPGGLPRAPGGSGGAPAPNGFGSVGRRPFQGELSPESAGVPPGPTAGTRVPSGGRGAGTPVSPSREDGWGSPGGGAGGGRGGGGGGSAELEGAAQAEAIKRDYFARAAVSDAISRSYTETASAYAGVVAKLERKRDALPKGDPLRSQIQDDIYEAQREVDLHVKRATQATKEADALTDAGLHAEAQSGPPGGVHPDVWERAVAAATAGMEEPGSDKSATPEKRAALARAVLAERTGLREAVVEDQRRAGRAQAAEASARSQIDRQPTLGGRVEAAAEAYARSGSARRVRELELLGLEQRRADLEADPRTPRDAAKRKALAKLLLDAPRREQERKRMVREDRRQATALAKDLRRLIARLERSDDPEDHAKAQALREQLKQLEDYLHATDPRNHKFVKPDSSVEPAPTSEAPVAAGDQVGLILRAPTPPLQFPKAIYAPDAANRIDATFRGGGRVLYADGLSFGASDTPVEPPQLPRSDGRPCARTCTCGPDCPPGQCVCTREYGPPKVPPTAPPGPDPLKPEGSGGGKLTPEDYKYGPVRTPLCPPGSLCQAQPEDPPPNPPPVGGGEGKTAAPPRATPPPVQPDGSRTTTGAGGTSSKETRTVVPCKELTQTEACLDAAESQLRALGEALAALEVTLERYTHTYLDGEVTRRTPDKDVSATARRALPTALEALAHAKQGVSSAWSVLGRGRNGVGARQGAPCSEHSARLLRECRALTVLLRALHTEVRLVRHLLRACLGIGPDLALDRVLRLLERVQAFAEGAIPTYDKPGADMGEAGDLELETEALIGETEEELLKPTRIEPIDPLPEVDWVDLASGIGDAVMNALSAAKASRPGSSTQPRYRRYRLPRTPGGQPPRPRAGAGGAGAGSGKRSGNRSGGGEPGAPPSGRYPDLRQGYLDELNDIGRKNQQWLREGRSPEWRAREAFRLRKDARLRAREGMSPEDVRKLEARDVEKYGHPDGPTFEQVVERARSSGLRGDAAYEGVVESSQRSDPFFNPPPQGGN